MKALTASLTIAETMDRWPATAGVFVARRMHCVGCEMNRFETIGEAAAAYGVSLHGIVGELRGAAGADADPGGV